MAALSRQELDEAQGALTAAGRDEATFTFDYRPYPRLGCGTGPPITHVAAGFYWPA